MSPPHRLRLAFAGSGQQLVASVQLALSRGHEVAGLLSDSEEVRQWSARAGLKLTSAADRGTWLDGESVDFLFSIVNHTLLGEKIVRRARRAAINYHDSLLPEYAGFNATAWAILEGRQTHGITWHVMTEEADAGDILLQRTIDIAEDDTAFSLGVKCATAGIETFGELLRLAEGNRLTPTPQAGARTYHRLSERPGVAVLDFSQPTDAVLRLVRSMNFGPEDRAMPRPKLLIGDDVLVVGDARRADGVGKPGTIISVSGTTIDVATADGAVQLYELSTIEGDSKDVSAVLSRAHLVTGDRLPVLLPAMAQELAELDQGIASSESWWVRRLAAATPGRLPIESNNAWAAGAVDLPQALRGRTADERDIIVKSAVAAFVRRLGAESGFDLWIAADIPDHARPFFADVVPLHCEVDVAGTFAALQSQVANETRRLKERRTYARDLPTRYASLRGHTAAPAIIFASPALAGRARDGAQAIIEIGETVRWHLRGASQTDAAELLARFSILLDEACAAPATPIAALPVLTPADRERVLTKWQQTGRDYDRTSTIIREFESQVDRTPDAVAVVFGTSELTYAALNARVNRLAHQLRGEGIGPNVLVGICVRRSTDMLVAMLAVLKAGGAYVPMDPSYPADRLKAMIDDSRASVVLTQQRIASKVPASAARVLDLDAADAWSTDESNPPAAARSGDLAYVLFTSGSTGRPKGVMLEHGNVVNFFAAMDEVLGPGKGVWLAVTSISFDISVLELLWTVSRGFKVIIAPESDRASLERPAETTRRVDFGLFYFAADSGATRTGNAYRLLTEGARYADENGFTAVWTPERHFHAFGGLYPNPAVTTAALATITRRVHLRAGSVVLPLHNPLRVAEDWAVIDQLSGGRIGLSFASGWHVNDFAFMPQNFERRREIMLEHIETILKLWRGEKVSVVNGAGQPIEVAVLPRPIQQRPPLWIASAGTADTFIMAGRLGANILTNMLGQDLADLKNKFAAYREARREAGHSGEGIISVMLHTFVTATDDEAKRLARKPFSAYLASSFDLVKVAPKMFPAFRQPSRGDHGVDTSAFTPEDMEALLDHAFDRYFETAGLFGTPERAVAMVDRLAEIGATEVACLIDFGIDPDVVLSNLPHLRRLQEMSRQRVVRRIDAEIEDVPQLMRRHGVTHLQCTPSLARALIADASGRPFLGQLKEMLVGGEALPPDLAAELTREVTGVVRNMYGPTETTVWSTTSRVQSGTPVTIGRAIANTTIRIVDSTGELTPPGVAGEILIGGDGVARGYFGRDDLTAERFIPDRWGKGRLYRTGDLGRYATSGEVEFLGRLDHQVKVNGYRIELGEIEAVLNTYPGIKQGVVVAKDAANGTGSELVGYVVRGDQPVLGGNHDRRVAEWRDIWEHTYRATDDGTADPRFRVGGWTNSYNGAPVVASEMREWIDATVERVHALGPKRILEIGCGTGMILYRMLPDVEHYTALDVSPAALDGIRAELTPAERERVTLIEASAHQLETIAGGSVDLVIINSVAQYFPDAEYLRSVLVKASELVRDGGHVFVGDVRSLAHLEAFHTAVAIHQAAPTATVADIRNRVDASVARESELLVADGFFDWVARNTPRYSGARVLLKTSRARNEMSAFRYDVVLDVASEDQAAAVPAAMPANSIDDVRRLVATGAPLIHLSDLQNARLSGIAEASRRLQAHASSTTGDLFPALGMSAGIDPADIAAIAPDYEVEMRWAASGDPWRFDALLRRRSVALRGRWPRPERVQAPSPTPMTNTPAHASQEQALVDVLQNHLRLALPEYMIPQTFVVLDALPLTPNRKIDRNALPAPRRAMTVGRIGYMAPASNLEEQIAGVWSDLLGVERVGRQDNIFDLGANSLLTMQANSRLTELLGRKVSLVSMFRFPTVESLAAHLSPAADGAADDHRVRERAQRAESAAERRRALRKER